MRLRYRLPDSKYFSMAFPEEIFLLPGLTHTLVVTFRPVHLESYDDAVQFSNERGVRPTATDSGGELTPRRYMPAPPAPAPRASPLDKRRPVPTGTFYIPIRAHVPSAAAVVPETLDFGFCPVDETAVRTFPISNRGQVRCCRRSPSVAQRRKTRSPAARP